MSYKKNVFPTVFIAVLIVGILFIGVNKEATNTSQENPGYDAQFFQMKQNEKGQIPRSLWKQWEAQTPKFHGKINYFSSVKEIGPNNIGGRTRALLVDSENSSHLLAGGVSGGIWQSTNAGVTWTPIDDHASTLSVTAITQNPFNPKEIYYSTGERSTGVYINYDGNGIFRSIDGGLSFNQIDSSDIPAFDKTWDIVYSKTDSNTFYIATNTSGLFRTLDKGASFQQIYKSGSKAINDIDVLANGVVYFSVDGVGIFHFDEAETPQIKEYPVGLSKGSFARCLVEPSQSNPDIIYAAFSGTDRNSLVGVYKTTNGGEAWTQLPNPQSRGISFNFTWYCFTLAVHPTNPNFVICSAQEPGYSTNGGGTWRDMVNAHADYHNVTFIPNSNNYYVLCDGGIYQYNTATTGTSATDRNTGYNVTQFYAGSFNPTGDEVIVGAQDNWTSTNNGGGSTFSRILGGDGAFNAIDITGEHIYASSQNGNIRRWNANRWVNIYNSLAGTVGTSDFWFINPFEINPTDGTQLYFPTKNYIARTTNRGSSWSRITNSIPGSIFAVGMTPEDNPTLYFGGQSGILYRVNSAKTATAGSEFKMFTLAPALARGGFVGNIEVDPKDQSTIYLALSNFSTLPRIWKVLKADTDKPEWVNISGNLPSSLPVNWIEVDPDNSDNIMVATDYGLYVTADGGRFWHKEDQIPNVYISMIRLRTSDRKLFVFTYGRGVWTATLNNSINTTVSDVTEDKLHVYPNPASSYTQISNFNGGTVELISSNGTTAPVEVNAAGQVNLNNVASGLYVIVHTNNGDQKVSRLIVD
ncbi:MAG: photosystem II stability/assembly factor-like uncharacterized protein [Bacteroidia bacterium]|jgi:photosystem II stability/assembly factor-like uncharacterized protein